MQELGEKMENDINDVKVELKKKTETIDIHYAKAALTNKIDKMTNDIKQLETEIKYQIKKKLDKTDVVKHTIVTTCGYNSITHEGILKLK